MSKMRKMSKKITLRSAFHSFHPVIGAVLLAALSLAGLACQSADDAELARLRKEVADLRSEAGENGEGGGGMPEEKLEHFDLDALRGTLAGLLPGDSLETARARFGPESVSRSWSSEGRPQKQYEWELEPGLFLRLNVESNGTLKKVAVALDGTRPTNIPVFAGVRLGQDTFEDLQRHFGGSLRTFLQFWGARGLYTIVQVHPVEGTRRYMEFSFQMPAGISTAQLTEIGEQIQMTNDGEVLEPYLNDLTPFQVALGYQE